MVSSLRSKRFRKVFRSASNVRKALPKRLLRRLHGFALKCLPKFATAPLFIYFLNFLLFFWFHTQRLSRYRLSLQCIFGDIFKIIALTVQFP